jgi:hypothetical protein
VSESNKTRACATKSPLQWILSLLDHALSDARTTYPYQQRSMLKYPIHPSGQLSL